MKYSNVSNYLAERFKEDLPPIFEPVTEQSASFEKAVVNNKRFVTKITKGTAPSQYGEKNVFVLEKGMSLQKEAVLNILKISKQTVEKFNEKFDWSRKRGQTSGYAQQPDGVLKVDEELAPESKPDQEQVQPQEEAKKEEGASQSSFSFDDIKF
jgi:hypothetical protein